MLYYQNGSSDKITMYYASLKDWGIIQDVLMNAAMSEHCNMGLTKRLSTRSLHQQLPANSRLSSPEGM